ncbi:SelT/SelW/SelH family protein [Aspergillus lucknowensis]|uniref:Rdx family-domain-containing protein n=1 Tax=Aspergillus lucknowensis TaxID=176173 RepID=A0ABR4LHK6_9EURO
MQDRMTEPTAPIEFHPPTSSTISPQQASQETNADPGPRITIQYCTQCKWMLRAAYFAQELLSTFGTDLGEVALIPRTGGIFRVTIFPSRSLSTATPTGSSAGAGAGAGLEGNGSGSGSDDSGTGTVLWDRKRDGGFPEVKVLKSLVRNVVDPSRDLGHTDRALRKDAAAVSASATAAPAATKSEHTDASTGKACEDCQ